MSEQQSQQDDHETRVAIDRIFQTMMGLKVNYDEYIVNNEFFIKFLENDSNSDA